MTRWATRSAAPLTGRPTRRWTKRWSGSCAKPTTRAAALSDADAGAAHAGAARAGAADGQSLLDTGLSSAALSSSALPPEERRLAAEARAGLRDGSLVLAKDAGPHHVTASCLLLSRIDEESGEPDSGRRFIALGLHLRSGQWRQFGGHIEAADTSLRAAAMRELREEAGVDAASDQVRLSPAPLAVRTFSVGSAACASHLDVLYAASAPHSHPLVTTDAGIGDVAWWPVDKLPQGTAEDLRTDLRALLQRTETDARTS